ncbi:MAG TPA: hypothetical protein VGW39_12205 [Chthoniobacterales bacterium]|nr:hypothetical protein [Chthoniobacterales bacterium]
MKDFTRYFSLVGAAVALLIFAYTRDVIRGSDIVLTILFGFGMFIEFGLPWRHRSWPLQHEPTKERIRWWLSKIYWMATLCTLIVPPLSLTAAYLLRVEAPKHVDGTIAGMMMPIPPTVPVITLNTASIASVPDASAKAYVAVFRSNREDVSLAAPVLQKTFAEIDRLWRATAAWYTGLAIAIVLVGLFFGEMFADMNISTNGTGKPSTASVNGRS